ncbi:hypothetical protein [Leptospira noguchii]|nr:hypothetical protein [Leptospira noguchii]
MNCFPWVQFRWEMERFERRLFLYQKNILFASKKLILSEHLKNVRF